MTIADRAASAVRTINELEDHLVRAKEENRNLQSQITNRSKSQPSNLLLLRDGSIRWHTGQVDGYRLVLPVYLTTAARYQNSGWDDDPLKTIEFERAPISILPYTLWIQRS